MGEDAAGLLATAAEARSAGLDAAGGVDGDARRRVFSVRMLGDDITHAPRTWVTSPPFPGLAERLPPGAPMQDALFPLLWPALDGALNAT